MANAITEAITSVHPARASPGRIAVASGALARGACATMPATGSAAMCRRFHQFRRGRMAEAAEEALAVADTTGMSTEFICEGRSESRGPTSRATRKILN